MKKDCTFRPNLEATKKMNLIFDIQGELSASDLLKIKHQDLGGRKYSQRETYLTPETWHLKSSKLSLHKYPSKLPKKGASNLQKTLVFNVDLVGNSKNTIYHISIASILSSHSVTNLNGLIRNGYTQRSIERKNFNKTIADCNRSIGCSLLNSKPGNNNLGISKSYQNIFERSYYSCYKSTYGKAAVPQTKKKDSLGRSVGNLDLQEVMSCHNKSASHISPNLFQSQRSSN